MHRTLPAVMAAAAVLLLTACAPSAEPTPTPAASSVEAAPTPSPTPTPAAGDSNAFGDTVELEYAGSVWSVTIQAPTATRPEVPADFPLDDPSTQYVTIPGSITRVSGEPMRPVSEVDVQIIVDRKIVDSEYLATGDSFPGSVNSLPETFAGGTGEFEQIFVVPAGTEVKTVSVTVGMGEASQRVFFGKAVDLGTASAEDTSANGDVESAKYIWNQAGQEYRDELLGILGAQKGQPVSDASVAAAVQNFNDIGIAFDTAEAREFVEWAVQQ